MPSREDVARAVAPHAEGATVALRVVPRARRTELVGGYGERLRLKVAAPPVDGAANAAVAAFVADRCGVRPSAVVVVAGERARDKVVLVRGIGPESLVSALH